MTNTIKKNNRVPRLVDGATLLPSQAMAAQKALYVPAVHKNIPKSSESRELSYNSEQGCIWTLHFGPRETSEILIAKPTRDVIIPMNRNGLLRFSLSAIRATVTVNTAANTKGGTVRS
jgi:hypothetical protein